MNRGRRILRVASNLAANRRDPPLDRLEREQDPERFLWQMLPHAARTFSLAIAVLPADLARTVGVAYLCCRILDTVEDLARDPAERDRLFDARRRVSSRDGTPLPELAAPWVQDARDRAHLILVRRSGVVAELLAIARGRDARRGSPACRAHGGRDEARGPRADRNRRPRRGRGARALLPRRAGRAAHVRRRRAPLRRSDCRRSCPPTAARPALDVGELVQLANVCRDVEKDLRRGVAYDPALEPWLGRAGRRPGGRRPRTCAAAFSSAYRPCPRRSFRSSEACRSGPCRDRAVRRSSSSSRRRGSSSASTPTSNRGRSAGRIAASRDGGRGRVRGRRDLARARAADRRSCARRVRGAPSSRLREESGLKSARDEGPGGRKRRARARARVEARPGARPFRPCICDARQPGDGRPRPTLRHPGRRLRRARRARAPRARRPDRHRPRGAALQRDRRSLPGARASGSSDPRRRPRSSRARRASRRT